MFLFWDNNIICEKYSNNKKKSDQIMKVYMHMYTLYCTTM